MSNIVISLKQKYGYSYIILGSGFIASAILFIIGGQTNTFIGTLTHFICSITSLALLLMKSETEDERSDKNIRKAGNSAFLYLMSLLLVFSSIIIVYKDFVINYKILVRIILGVGLFLYGYFFLHYEKEGY